MRLHLPALRTPTRREFLTVAALAGVGLMVDAAEIDRHHLVVEHRTAPIANLPASFHGFRIAHISDIHYEHYMERWFLRHVVARINALQPDMVAITGDFLTSNGHPLNVIRTQEDEVAELLDGIACPHRFCSLGNHDGIDFDGVTRALQRRYFDVLDNRYTALDRGGDRLWIGGIADAMFSAPDLPRAIPADRRHAPTILLGHEPDLARNVHAYGGVDLMLAGHTHGGQVRIPFLPAMFLPDLGRLYIEGMYRVGSLQLNVNRGLGTVHLPIRFRCPPEITLLTLQHA